MMSVRLVPTQELSPVELRSIRDLCDAAWADGSFGDHDWDHALGGTHAVCEDDGGIVAHGSVVARTLRAGGTDLAAGYVEAVATLPGRQRHGFGSAVMRALTDHIDATYALGALCTGVAPTFYERLGWRLWDGPTSVLIEGVAHGTPDEDGTVMVRMTPSSPALDPSQPISCDWRPGDVW